ncbi:cytochrome c oxidase assembly protein [Kineococcus sp. SYSU DK001]|uniref:cytochrome c oxidase assembly protein n=1 Tax=Kineococcus sp. SYSU DK001 TaxID=3383122 RepID=UPI003D7E8C37
MPEVVVVAALLLAAVGYGAAVRAARGRGPWPVHRTVCWCAGLLCVAAGTVGPLARAAHHGFTAHTGAHLALGMVAPLLLVLAAPVTVALRALPVRRARTLSRVLRWPPVRVVSHPVVAGVLNAGGLWVLYRTDLFALMHTSVAVHVLVHAHLFLAGYLFTASVAGRDPDPHRASLRLRFGVLVVFVAVHSVLAKSLYADPPPGVAVADAERGAQLMYYGGDVVDLALMVLVVAGWYRARGTRPGPADAVAAPAS